MAPVCLEQPHPKRLLRHTLEEGMLCRTCWAGTLLISIRSFSFAEFHCSRADYTKLKHKSSWSSVIESWYLKAPMFHKTLINKLVVFLLLICLFYSVMYYEPYEEWEKLSYFSFPLLYHRAHYISISISIFISINIDINIKRVIQIHNYLSLYR